VLAYPHLSEVEGGRLFTRGEFVGAVLKGSTAWERRRRNMRFRASQELEKDPITVRARTREDAESRIRSEGKIGFVIGPMELGGGGGKERGTTKGSEVEIEYKVRLATDSLKIENLSTTEGTSAESEDEDAGDLAFETSVLENVGPDRQGALSEIGTRSSRSQRRASDGHGVGRTNP
jgi:hypothetical protein